SIVSVKISIRSSTSSGERDQFSVENAKTESDSTPRSIAASTVRRSARVPARWPAAVGKRRRRAQRELPSMMIATDRAISGSSGSTVLMPRRARILVRRLMCRRLLRGKCAALSAALDLENLGFLALQQLVDLVHVVVGQLLRAFFGAPLLVVADVALADQLL